MRITSSALEAALVTLQDRGFRLEDLPLEVNSNSWTRIQLDFRLSLNEVVALQNHVCEFNLHRTQSYIII